MNQLNSIVDDRMIQVFIFFVHRHVALLGISQTVFTVITGHFFFTCIETIDVDQFDSIVDNRLIQLFKFLLSSQTYIAMLEINSTVFTVITSLVFFLKYKEKIVTHQIISIFNNRLIQMFIFLHFSTLVLGLDVQGFKLLQSHALCFQVL